MSDASFEAAEPTDQYIEPAVAAAPATRKQGMNIYTMMLVISFICLLIGTIILFVEYQKFGGWDTGTAEPQTWITPIQQLDQFPYV